MYIGSPSSFSHIHDKHTKTALRGHRSQNSSLIWSDLWVSVRIVRDENKKMWVKKKLQMIEINPTCGLISHVMSSRSGMDGKRRAVKQHCVLSSTFLDKQGYKKWFVSPSKNVTPFTTRGKQTTTTVGTLDIKDTPKTIWVHSRWQSQCRFTPAQTKTSAGEIYHIFIARWICTLFFLC